MSEVLTVSTLLTLKCAKRDRERVQLGLRYREPRRYFTELAGAVNVLHVVSAVSL